MMIKRKITPPGVYRADDDKGWVAFVVASKRKATILGIYPTIRKAVAARTSYWKKRKLR